MLNLQSSTQAGKLIVPRLILITPSWHLSVTLYFFWSLRTPQNQLKHLFKIQKTTRYGPRTAFQRTPYCERYQHLPENYYSSERNPSTKPPLYQSKSALGHILIARCQTTATEQRPTCLASHRNPRLVLIKPSSMYSSGHARTSFFYSIQPSPIANPVKSTVSDQHLRRKHASSNLI